MSSEAELTAEERRAAEAVFGDRLPLAERYVHHLATSGMERGLLGPREVPRLWSRHVLNCAVVADLIAENAKVADVGSGAGLPGLALAIARPDLDLTLVEPLERRCVWLQEVVEDLGLDNVTVMRGRAEQVVDLIDADVATARAVSALTNLAGLTIRCCTATGRSLRSRAAAPPRSSRRPPRSSDAWAGRKPRSSPLAPKSSPSRPRWCESTSADLSR